VSEVEILNEALKRELLEHEKAIKKLEVMRDGVINAIASHRPYREALGLDFALYEISDKKNIFFDESATNACIRILKKGFKLNP